VKRQSKQKDPSVYFRSQPPPLTPEDQENRMINLAMKAAEEQLLEGTASSQVITHFLKLAATKEQYRLEIEKLKGENALLRAKTEAIEAAPKLEEMYKRAVDAMRDYGGNGDVSNDEEETEDEDSDVY